MRNHSPCNELFRKLDADLYEVQELSRIEDYQEYDALLSKVYEPLGFMSDRVRPCKTSRCYRVRHADTTVAVFRLTKVTDPRSDFHRLIPELACTPSEVEPLLEVNNVVIEREYRGTPTLGVILRFCARQAASEQYRAVVGITRYQTLRYFAEFGVLPVSHEPLHVLGRSDLLDFIIYYDTRDPASRQYMEERTTRVFKQLRILKEIETRYGRGALGNQTRRSAA